MTTQFEFGIDWRRKGIICWDAAPGAALNVLPKPLTYSTVDFRTDNVTSALLEQVDSPVGFETKTGSQQLPQNRVQMVDHLSAYSRPECATIHCRGAPAWAPGLAPEFMRRPAPAPYQPVRTLSQIAL